MLESSRRRAIAWLNNSYIYGRWPLLHSIVIFIEFCLTMTLIAKFNAAYARRPVLTTMVTNAILGGIADTVAQSITAFRQRSKSIPETTQTRSFISSDSVELEDLDNKGLTLSRTLSATPLGPQPFDFERLTRFMSYGFLMAPIQLKWFSTLSKLFPITKTSGTVPAMKRVAMDQLIFAPLGLTAFFTFMTLTEGGGKDDVLHKFQHVYVPTLRANYILWPAVQILNFRVMPIQFQLPFVSTVGIAWTAYLSLANAKGDEESLE